MKRIAQNVALLKKFNNFLMKIKLNSSGYMSQINQS